MSQLRSSHSLAISLRRPGAAAQERYDNASILLHWGSAILIGLNWLIGQGRSLAPPGEPRSAMLSTHILIGLTIGVLLMARLAWRAGPGRRVGNEPSLAGLLAKAVHATLYGLIAVTVLAGAAGVLAHGPHLFGAAVLPRFDLWPHGPLYMVGRLHNKLADILIVLAGLHALAALGHHVVLRDGVLMRMVPFLPKRLRPSRPTARRAETAKRMRR
jgi:cytochrome b561